MTLPTFKLFYDAEKTQALPIVNGLPVLRVQNNGIVDQVATVYLGSNSAGVRLRPQDGSTDTVVKVSLVEKSQLWEASKAVTAGKIVRPSNGQMYKCTSSGVTGATEPIWPMNAGFAVNDGTAKWVNLGLAYTLNDVALALSHTAAETATAKVVSLPAQILSSDPAIPLFVRIKNNDPELKTDATDCVIQFHYNKVTEEKV